MGLSVFSVGYEKCGDRKFPEQKIAALLDSGTYHKVFISLGLNEAGYKLEDLLNKYGDLISLIQEKQPGVKIILQGIMTVSRGKANSDRAFSLENLGRINEGIAAMADGEQIFYIDVNEIFADEEGYLLDGLSGDGCHLYGKYGVVWEDWIRYASAQLEIE